MVFKCPDLTLLDGISLRIVKAYRELLTILSRYPFLKWTRSKLCLKYSWDTTIVLISSSIDFKGGLFEEADWLGLGLDRVTVAVLREGALDGALE
jgi:hypothetical protein